MLKSLAATEPEVYYVAPAFRRQGDFNRLFANGEIFTNTVFIPLNSLPSLTDDEQHYITYDASFRPTGFRWHSDEGKYFDRSITGKEWVEHLRTLMAQPRELGLHFLFQLHDTLIHIIKEHPLQQELFDNVLPTTQSNDVDSLLREVRNLLASFGVVLIFLRRPL